MRIICIGRNYAEHAKELNNAVPEEPVFFMKPDTALVKDNQPFYYPDFSQNIHHEAEIVLKICKNGKQIEEKFANKYYEELTIGIDFTARDIQDKCKQKSLPWEKAKAFDNSAPIGTFISKNDLADINSIQFHLDINGKKVQDGNTKDLLFTFDKIITHVSKFVTLKIGDLIFTGTPEGVGAVQIGDKMEAYIGDKKLLAFEIK